jgi:hypothetical protein
MVQKSLLTMLVSHCHHRIAWELIHAVVAVEKEEAEVEGVEVVFDHPTVDLVEPACYYSIAAEVTSPHLARIAEAVEVEVEIGVHPVSTDEVVVVVGAAVAVDGGIRHVAE